MRRLGLLLVVVLLLGCDATNEFAVGTLEWDRVELITEFAEPIVEIARREGDRLEKGAVILKLDPERTAARLAEAEAAAALADARLQELQRGTRPERLEDARARLQGSEAALASQRREVARTEKLLEQKLASPEALDVAQRLLDAANTEYERARASLAELVNGATREELAQAGAQLAQAQAQVRLQRVNLERLNLRAPVAGRLDDLPYRLGEQPAVGNVVALVLAGEGPYARVFVPEPLRVRVRPGLGARVWVDGLDQPLAGVVRRVGADPAFTPYYALTDHDRGRLSYLAEVDLVDAPGDLPAGVGLKVRFDTDPAAGR